MLKNFGRLNFTLLYFTNLVFTNFTKSHYLEGIHELKDTLLVTRTKSFVNFFLNVSYPLIDSIVLPVKNIYYGRKITLHTVYTLYSLLNVMLLYSTVSSHATTPPKWDNATAWRMRPPTPTEYRICPNALLYYIAAVTLYR